MVRTTFRLFSFMCDNSHSLAASIRTGWGRALKTNRQPLTLIIGLSKLESGYKGKSTLCRGPIMDSLWECVFMSVCVLSAYICVCVCVCVCVSHESNYVSVYWDSSKNLAITHTECNWPWNRSEQTLWRLLAFPNKTRIASVWSAPLHHAVAARWRSLRRL